MTSPHWGNRSVKIVIFSRGVRFGPLSRYINDLHLKSQHLNALGQTPPRRFRGSVPGVGGSSTRERAGIGLLLLAMPAMLPKDRACLGERLRPQVARSQRRRQHSDGASLVDNRQDERLLVGL